MTEVTIEIAEQDGEWNYPGPKPGSIYERANSAAEELTGKPSPKLTILKARKKLEITAEAMNRAWDLLQSVRESSDYATAVANMPKYDSETTSVTEYLDSLSSPQQQIFLNEEALSACLNINRNALAKIRIYSS